MRRRTRPGSPSRRRVCSSALRGAAAGTRATRARAGCAGRTGWTPSCTRWVNTRSNATGCSRPAPAASTARTTAGSPGCSPWADSTAPGAARSPSCRARRTR
ncbi:MAG: hypothetical protein GEU80_10880 [Dehalococcoidia bacterium]|nr:hypothetical protein [Dehalococcoidia bacterium]